MDKIVVFADSIDQNQTAQNVQSDSWIYTVDQFSHALTSKNLSKFQ